MAAAQLTEVLEDLCFRFIVNCPKEDLESFEVRAASHPPHTAHPPSTQRLCFQIELAHWFYEDHYRELDKTLPPLGWKEFAKKSAPMPPVAPSLTPRSLPCVRLAAAVREQAG